MVNRGGTSWRKLCEILRKLNTDDGDARDDAYEKVDLNFTLEFAMPVIISIRKSRIFAIVALVLQKMQNLVISIRMLCGQPVSLILKSRKS